MTDLSIQNIETAGNGAKKNIPWGYHGMRHIPGGAPIRWTGGLIRITPHQRQNRDILRFSEFCSIHTPQKTNLFYQNSLQK